MTTKNATRKTSIPEKLTRVHAERLKKWHDDWVVRTRQDLDRERANVEMYKGFIEMSQRSIKMIGDPTKYCRICLECNEVRDSGNYCRICGTKLQAVNITNGELFGPADDFVCLKRATEAAAKTQKRRAS